MPKPKQERPWNWCHKCRQTVGVDGNSQDGSMHRCWGCDRELMLVCFGESVDPMLVSETQDRRMSRVAKKRLESQKKSP